VFSTSLGVERSLTKADVSSSMKYAAPHVIGHAGDGLKYAAPHVNGHVGQHAFGVCVGLGDRFGSTARLRGWPRTGNSQ
jgi:hypothetical protein